MSNCASVKGGVTFPAGVIDTERLIRLIESVKFERTPPEWTAENGDRVMAWWFMNGAMTILEGGAVRWTPGQGCRSTHTFRDLKGTVETLAGMATRPFTFKLLVADEDAPGPFMWTKFGWTKNGKEERDANTEG